MIRHIRTAVLGAAVLSAVLPQAVSAHATFETTEAPAHSIYKAVIRIGHGCEGSPTTAIRVQIPEGVIAVKPMPKTGWELATVKGKYAQTYDYYGTPMAEGVKEVSWSGNSLADEHYDEFVFRALLPDAPEGTVIWFPVVQQCKEGVHRWIEIPAAGKGPDDYKEPAPGVRLTAKRRGH